MNFSVLKLCHKFIKLGNPFYQHFVPVYYNSCRGFILNKTTVLIYRLFGQISAKQECIPVECIPPTAVAVRGSASVHAGIHPPRVGLETPPGVGRETPQVWAWSPPGVGNWIPPGCGPGDPSGCGTGDPPSVGLETPLARPLNFLPGCVPGNLQGMLECPPTPSPL